MQGSVNAPLVANLDKIEVLDPTMLKISLKKPDADALFSIAEGHNKLLAHEGELYVFAKSRDRVQKERAMRRRRLKQLLARLRELAGMKLKRDALLIKIGQAKAEAGRAFSLVDLRLPKAREPADRRPLASRSTNPNCAKSFGAKAATCCAPTTCSAARRANSGHPRRWRRRVSWLHRAQEGGPCWPSIVSTEFARFSRRETNSTTCQ